jgi:hypothetical protein
MIDITGKYYVYTYSYPDGGPVFYIGKGTLYTSKTIAQRVDMHEYHTRRGKRSRVYDVIRRIWAQGKSPVKKIVYQSDEEYRALAVEHDLIQLYKGSGFLTNIAIVGAPSGKHDGAREAPVGYCTASDIAKSYGRGVQTIQKWCRIGAIRGARRVGRDWIIPSRYASGAEEIILTDQQREDDDR